VDPVQDSAEVPEVPRTTLVGVRVHVRPAGLTEDVSATVPVNPSRLVTVIVDVAAALASAVALVGLAVTVKSWIVTVKVAVCVMPLLLPVIVTV